MARGAPTLPDVDVSLGGGTPFQPDSLLGTVVAGRYRLSAHLASGGMAAVYVAEDTRTRHDVALKVLRPDLSRSPEVVRRFLCEGSIAGLVRHENVVRVLDHGGEEGRTCFIAMELLEGEGLFDRLRRRGALPPAEAIGILLQVCAGLQAAHEQGVIHRDLKPENVFLHGGSGEAPVAKILDFGVAGGANGEGVEAGMVVGTPDYLSPEQAFGRAVDARSDVYSLGLVAWRMLAGRAPFSAPSADEMIRLQARAPVPPLTDVRPELSAWPDLVSTVALACAKKPADRPPSAATFAKLLQRALRTGGPAPVATPVPRPAPAFADPSPRPPAGPGAPVASRAPSSASGLSGSTLPGPPAPRRRERAVLAAILLAVAVALTVTGAALWLHQAGGGAARASQAAPAP
ncbi:MAG TPA: serine/threonine-protein kinase [Anaeromyxobacteraceae bacterium]|nr:serine/threonine-protein kinase [Anaeromyxobacteraceae bacterium]